MSSSTYPTVGITDETREFDAGLDFTEAVIPPEAQKYVMKILATFYSDPKYSVIRELLANALDSQKTAGVDSVTEPVIVHVPTPEEPWLSVTDHGTGMDRDDLVNTYANYISTKYDDPDVIGTMGVGAKSVYSVAGRFTVTATKDGVTHEVVFALHPSGNPSSAIAAVHADPDVPDGVCVTVPVTPSYTVTDEWHDAVVKAASFLDQGTVRLSGRAGAYYEPTSVLTRISDAPKIHRGPATVTFTNDAALFDSRIWVVSAGMLYRVPDSMQTRNVCKILSNTLLVNVPVKYFEIVPNREFIADTEENRRKLNALLSGAEQEILDRFTPSPDQNPSVEAVAKAMTTLSANGLTAHRSTLVGHYFPNNTDNKTAIDLTSGKTLVYDQYAQRINSTSMSCMTVRHLLDRIGEGCYFMDITQLAKLPASKKSSVISRWRTENNYPGLLVIDPADVTTATGDDGEPDPEYTRDIFDNLIDGKFTPNPDSSLNWITVDEMIAATPVHAVTRGKTGPATMRVLTNTRNARAHLRPLDELVEQVRQNNSRIVIGHRDDFPVRGARSRELGTDIDGTDLLVLLTGNMSRKTVAERLKVTTESVLTPETWDQLILGKLGNITDPVALQLVHCAAAGGDPFELIEDARNLRDNARKRKQLASHPKTAALLKKMSVVSNQSRLVLGLVNQFSTVGWSTRFHSRSTELTDRLTEIDRAHPETGRLDLALDYLSDTTTYRFNYDILEKLLD